MPERTFQENLILILSSIYGSDVRVAIHDALQQAYNHGEEPSGDAATDATLDALTAALASALGLTISKTYDAANSRYIYTIGSNGESTTGTGFVVIDDSDVTTNKTWSSQKISDKFDEIDDTFEALVSVLSDL